MTKITNSTPPLDTVSWHYLVKKVSIQPTSDLLTALRSNLARIDGLAKEDQTPATVELRALLLRRIAILDPGPPAHRGTVTQKS